ncbi:MAG: UDP-2,3-diacylglucosamine diphosphatase, partial [Myxococcota bacterium]|nr:UDP-2,3-diacylglucosamine diphosphatase [Myxococcota bacterium]
DLHVSSADSPRTKRLLSLLDEMAHDAESIYLVGDVFDFWLGYKSVIFSEYYPLLRTLERLVKRGVNVVIFSGNHDPDPGPFFSQINVTVEEHARGFKLGPHNIWLDHGDLIDPRSLFSRLICRAARQPTLRRYARLIHPDVAWRLSRIYGKKREGYTEPLPSELLTDYLPNKIKAGYDTVIIGHYHRAVSHRTAVDGINGQLFALGDWVEQRTYLKYDGTFQLLRDQGASRPPLLLSHGDHAPDSSSGPFS